MYLQVSIFLTQSRDSTMFQFSLLRCRLSFKSNTYSIANLQSLAQLLKYASISKDFSGFDSEAEVASLERADL